jgi:hypothetical protein
MIFFTQSQRKYFTGIRHGDLGGNAWKLPLPIYLFGNGYLKTDRCLQNVGVLHPAGTMRHKATVALCSVLTCPGTNLLNCQHDYY